MLREKEEPDDDDKPADKPKSPKPIVIQRYQFREDVDGYLTDKRAHVYLFDIATSKLDELTKDEFDETDAVFSPDGSLIAFVSNRDADPDRTKNTDVFVIEPQVGAVPKKLTAFEGPDAGRLAWSPDGKQIAYLQGSEPKYNAYNLDKLALVGVDGGTPKLLTSSLDRGVAMPVFAADGKAIYGVVADDGSEYPAVFWPEVGPCSGWCRHLWWRAVWMLARAMLCLWRAKMRRPMNSMPLRMAPFEF